MPCDIIQLGNPILRRPAEAVAGTDIDPLVAEMLAAMEAADGVGIAAPQIGVSRRICIVASRPSVRYPLAPAMEPLVLLNPRIEWPSPEAMKEWEGCLSVPGIRGLVPRSTRVRVRYAEPHTGADTVGEFHGFVARIIQHELDHLDGLVFLDRVESTRELVTEQEYRRIMEQTK